MAVHAKRPRRQARRCAPTGSTLASRQPSPPFVLTSNLFTGARPEQGHPFGVTVPGRTIRARDMKSGKPGGTSEARGAIRVTGSPSSGHCLSR
ncbi:hypothetical protein ACFXPN_43155 [Streptomyces griseorubiginosus]|uniref:hypothetical protein n=1 Tax=Streptomyces griseorubiginosus TaxID=67304 RepID=UPI003687BE0C